MAGVAAIKDRIGTIKLPSFSGLLRGRAPGDRSPFASSFRQGLLYGLIVCTFLAGWMLLRSGETARRLQPLIPAKTTMIEVPDVDQTKDADAPEKALTTSRSINALPPAPLEGLSETKDGKVLPMTRISDDTTPFDAYKKPFTVIAGRPLVSFVVADYGLSESLTQSMLDNLPPEVTFVLNPYAPSLTKWAAAARAYGHEFWVELPMQSADMTKDDSGPGALRLNVPEEQNIARLFDVLAVAPGYAGVVTATNHAFTGEDVDAGPVMKQILGRGLGFAESNPGVRAYGLSYAMEFGYPYVQNNMWLDSRLRPEAIDSAIRAMELQASQKGKVIVFLHPYPVVVNKVQEWIKGAALKGYQVAPLSATVN